MKSIALLVLNWNGVAITLQGKPLLDFCLPSFLAAAEKYEGEARVVLVDNKSSDDSVAYVKEKYPAVEIFEAQENKWLFSYNDAIETLDTDVIMLLNNDIYMDEHCIANFMKHFSDPSVFCAGPDVFQWKNGEPSPDPDSRCMRMHFYKGRLFPVDISGVIPRDLPNPFYVLGGAVAYDRRKLVRFDMLDTVFYPYTFEDSDIACRANLRNLKVCIEESSKVYHLGSASINPSGANYSVQKVALQNEYIFMWKNIRSFWMRMQTLLFIPYHALRYRFGGIPFYARALCSAIKKIPQIRKRRKQQFARATRSDSDTLFLNHDLPEQVRTYMMAKICTVANEPERAFVYAQQLCAMYPDAASYEGRQIAALFADILGVLYQSQKYAQIVKQSDLIPDAYMSSRGRYVVAASYRELGAHDKASALYNVIVADGQEGFQLKGLSHYHIASIALRNNELERVKENAEACLRYIPEHGKAQELLEEYALA